MKKDVKIYKHNKDAFKKVLEAFKTADRTCVIHPTGTGKMYITLQLIDKFKKCKMAYITSYSPILFKLKDDMEKTEVFNDSLYAGLYAGIDTELYDLDYIILDEFHHAGAPVWGARLQKLLLNNPQAKVLGLSATPIRYLDGGRNMADELFNSNISSNIGLAEAIGRGILKMPRYINAIYSFKEIIEDRECKVTKINDMEGKEMGLRYLEEARHCLEKADGLAEVFEKNITVKDGKYIVFCRSVKHIETMINECKSWFKNVNKNVDAYVVKSDNSEEVNKHTLKRFELADDSHLKLLFCINMINEGTHIKNDGIIMFRPTGSMNTYLQQLGRAVSVDNEDTIVFDIVNNSDNIKMFIDFKEEVIKYAKKYNNLKNIDLDRFEIIESHASFMKIINKIDKILSICLLSWDNCYNLAKDYYEKHGNLDVPYNYNIDGLYLRMWLDGQRYMYHHFTLSSEKIILFESIGIIWNVADNNWDIRYNLAKDYYEKHGNLLIPRTYTINGIKLGQWIINQRTKYKNHTLSKEKIAMLEDIGMVWSVVENSTWYVSYNLAKDYYEKHGNLLIPRTYTINGIKLGQWLVFQRVNYRKGILSEEKINLLEAIGIVWNVRPNNTWDTMYNLAKDYYEKHGNLNIPFDYIINDICLGTWIAAQRVANKNHKLSKVQVDLLNSIGMIWEVKRGNIGWDTAYNLVKDYYEKHGNLNIPYDYVIDGIKLKTWLDNQRAAYNKGKLSEDRIQKLESIGMNWNPRNK